MKHCDANLLIRGIEKISHSSLEQRQDITILSFFFPSFPLFYRNMKLTFTLMIVCTSYTRPKVPGPPHHKEPDGEQPSSKWWSTRLAHYKIMALKLMIPSQMFKRRANSSHTPGNSKIVQNKIAIKLFSWDTVFLAQVKGNITVHMQTFWVGFYMVQSDNSDGSRSR